MASGVTNKGKHHLLSITFRNATEPTNYYVALVTSANTPTVDTNTLSQLTELANGNGYTTGGIQITRGDGSSGIGFDVLTEDDSADTAYIQLEDLVWTAAGGSLPASGGARYAVLTDDNGTVGSREVYCWWDLSSDRQVTDTQTLTLVDCKLTIA
jgi:hypothetical protein